MQMFAKANISLTRENFLRRGFARPQPRITPAHFLLLYRLVGIKYYLIADLKKREPLPHSTKANKPQFVIKSAKSKVHYNTTRQCCTNKLPEGQEICV